MIDEWKKGAKYWDSAFNPVIGCRKVSAGCKNCYAERMTMQFSELQDAQGGFSPHCPKVGRKPQRKGVVFVGNMTDIFGEWNTFEQIDRWIKSLSRDAVNLILTKRPERMYEYMKQYVQDCRDTHLWWGITMEDARACGDRERYLMIPFQRWVSAEPLLSPIEFDEPLGDWCVVGAESGNNRRPCNIEWVRRIVQRYRENHIPVFVKQLEIDGKLVKDIEQFPEDLQIRQVPWCKRGENVIR